MANKEKAERAKIFLPFDALKGLREALREKEKVLVDKKQLAEDEVFALSQRLVQVKKGDIILVVYFENHEYIQLEGIVTKIDTTYQYLTIVSKTIPFGDILTLRGASIRDEDDY